MIVPDYWAEAKRKHRKGNKQVTVRRFGWSCVSEEEAVRMAEARATEALQEILAGRDLHRRERKVAYNGADGVPIREEVLERFGENVITRNSYGAQCLNSPNALFADIDFRQDIGPRSFLLAFLFLLGVAIAIAWQSGNRWIWASGFIAAFVLAGPLASLVRRSWIVIRGGDEQDARRRMVAFADRNPAWNLRVYRTPAGFRILVTHQPFDATSPETTGFFRKMRTDPIYVRMCQKQRCFRARLTAKPWRIGITQHLRPRPGVWPIRLEHREKRNDWVKHYESEAVTYAACKYVESIGSGMIHPNLREIVELHDKRSNAMNSTAPLA